MPPKTHPALAKAMIVEFMDCGAKSSIGPAPVSISAPKTRPQAPKDPAPKAKVSKAKASNLKKEAVAEVEEDSDNEPADRLPTEFDELKETKSGLGTFRFLRGREGGHRQGVVGDVQAGAGAGREDRAPDRGQCAALPAPAVSVAG